MTAVYASGEIPRVGDVVRDVAPLSGVYRVADVDPDVQGVIYVVDDAGRRVRGVYVCGEDGSLLWRAASCFTLVFPCPERQLAAVATLAEAQAIDLRIARDTLVAIVGSFDALAESRADRRRDAAAHWKASLSNAVESARSFLCSSRARTAARTPPHSTEQAAGERSRRERRAGESPSRSGTIARSGKNSAGAKRRGVTKRLAARKAVR